MSCELIATSSRTFDPDALESGDVETVSERLVENLKWELRFQRDGHSIATLTDRGVPYEGLPDWYREEPVLEGWDPFYSTAFWRLSTERSIGFAMGAIPHSKIVEYGSRVRLTTANMQLFEAVIRAMDSAYIEWSSQQQTRARNANRQPEIPVAGNKTKRPKPRE